MTLKTSFKSSRNAAVYISCFSLLSLNMLNAVTFSASADDDLPWDAKDYAWTLFGGQLRSKIVAKVADRYTSLQGNEWIVDIALDSGYGAYQNIAYCLENMPDMSIPFDNLQNGFSYGGIYQYPAGQHEYVNFTMSPSHMGYNGTDFRYNIYGNQSYIASFPSGRNTLFELDGGRRVETGKSNYTDIDIPPHTLSAGGGEIATLSWTAVMMYSYIEDAVYPSTPTFNYYENPTSQYPDAGIMYVPGSYLRIYSFTDRINFSDFGVSDWSSLSNVMDSIKNWADTNYPDIEPLVPYPDFSGGGTVGDYTLPSLIYPPDLPLETFPALEMPTIPDNVMSSVSNGIGFHFSMLNKIVEKFNIQWLVVLMLIIALFFMIFAR